jgi:hypothetical protein
MIWASKEPMRAIEALQKSLENSNKADKAKMVQWKGELQQSVQPLSDCIKTYLGVLLQRAEKTLGKEGETTSSKNTISSIPLQIIMGTVQIISTSIASGLPAAWFSTSIPSVKGEIKPPPKAFSHPTALSSSAAYEVAQGAHSTLLKNLLQETSRIVVPNLPRRVGRLPKKHLEGKN